MLSSSKMVSQNSFWLTILYPVPLDNVRMTVSVCSAVPSPSVVVDDDKAKDAAGCDVLIVVGNGQRMDRVAAQGVPRAANEG